MSESNLFKEMERIQKDLGSWGKKHPKAVKIITVMAVIYFLAFVIGTGMEISRKKRIAEANSGINLIYGR